MLCSIYKFLTETLWGQAFVSILAAIAFFTLDLFGLRTLSNSYSRNLFIPIVAPFYPAEGQRHVTTVIVDDAAAEEMAERYPIGLSEHGRLLRRMLCEGPSVIVVAVAFRYLRDGDAGVEGLKSQLLFRRIDGGCRQVTPGEAREGQALDAQGQLRPVTKVLLAASSGAGGRCVPFSAAIADECVEARKIDSLKQVAEPVDFARTTLDNSYLLWRPLVKDGPLVPSPAVRAFAAFCERVGRALATCAAPLLVDDATLVTHWGLYPPQLQAKLSDATGHMRPDAPCLGAHGQPADRIGQLRDVARVVLRLARLNGLGNMDEEPIEKHPSCRYTSEINAALLFSRPNGDPLLSEALRDRVVVYGIEIAGIRDDELVPIFGRVPGAHFNAMVIDNLISFGNAYKREPAQITVGRLKVSALNLIELAWTSVLILVATWLAAPGFSTSTGLCGGPRLITPTSLAYYAFVAASVCAIVYLVVFVWNWPAPNVIGVLSVKAFDAGTRSARPGKVQRS